MIFLPSRMAEGTEGVQSLLNFRRLPDVVEPLGYQIAYGAMGGLASASSLANAFNSFRKSAAVRAVLFPAASRQRANGLEKTASLRCAPCPGGSPPRAAHFRIEPKAHLLSQASAKSNLRPSLAAITRTPVSSVNRWATVQGLARHMLMPKWFKQDSFWLQALDDLGGVRHGEMVPVGPLLQSHQVDNEKVSLVVPAEMVEVACVEIQELVY